MQIQRQMGRQWPVQVHRSLVTDFWLVRTQRIMHMDCQNCTPNLEWCSFPSKWDTSGPTGVTTTMNTSLQASSQCASNCKKRCENWRCRAKRTQVHATCYRLSKAKWCLSWFVKQLQSSFVHSPFLHQLLQARSRLVYFVKVASKRRASHDDRLCSYYGMALSQELFVIVWSLSNTELKRPGSF